jgi:hypothetical protein
MAEIKYKTPFVFHYRGQKNRAITVVYDPTSSRFGVSICGKRDHFCKKLGRAIAQGRCKTGSSAGFSYLYQTSTVEEVCAEARSIARALANKYHIRLEDKGANGGA